MRCILAVLIVLYTFCHAYAQKSLDDRSTAKNEEIKIEEEEIISDNSFLIEEAYNQEPGVVQHINTFSRNTKTNDWLYSFTQEWPASTEKHQLSYTLQRLRVTSGPEVHGGSGDTLLNYRYQAVLNKKHAFSPRLSLVLPTGDYKRGLGRGGPGVQINLPLSVRLSKKWVSHTNAGITVTSSAKDAFDNTARTQDLNLGQSFIFLMKPDFNLMLEAAWTQSESVSGPGVTTKSRSFYVSPGVRWAINYKNGLQIVPGIAFPIGVGPSKGERGVFFYISFEHPFKKVKQ